MAEKPWITDKEFDELRDLITRAKNGETIDRYRLRILLEKMRYETHEAMAN